MDTATAAVTPTDVIRAMQRAYGTQPDGVRFDLFPAVYGTTYATLGVPRNTPEGIRAADPIAEGALALILQAAGVADDGTDRTPACMATVERAREVLDIAADPTLLLAHLVGVVPAGN